MAEVLQGSFSTNKYTTASHGTLGINVSWTATQNIADNTSTIKWTVKSNGTMSSGYYVKCYKVIVKINGTKVLNTTSEFNMRGDGGYKKTGTITIAHGSDGKKTVAMTAQANIYYAGDGNARTGSDSFDLKTINRYALLTSGTDFTNEVGTNGYPNIVYTNPAGIALTSNLKARITWKDTNDQDQATSWVTLNDEGGTYTFNSSSLTAANINSMLAACPEANFLAVKFDLQSTMGGVDYHNYKDAVMNVVNANPVFTTEASYQDANATVVSIAGGNIVQRQSKLQILHGTAAAQKGASLANSPYTLNFNGADYGFVGNYVEFDKPDLAGTYRATITAKDTRGNTATSYFDVEILDWTEPAADCLLERQNSFESTCDFKVTAHISSLAGYNVSHLAIMEKHKEAGSQNWSQPASVQDDTLTTLSLANNSAWDVVVSVTDAFATTDYTLSVGKGIPFLFKDRHRNSIGFNAIPDEDDQVIIGEDCTAKVNRVKFPYVYSTTEKIVGYWIDGRPIYKRLIELSSDVSLSANAWKNSALTVEEDIIIIDAKTMYYNSQYDAFSIWNFVAAQTNTSNKKAIDLYNSRDSACSVNMLVIEYIKPTQNNS